MEIWVYENFFYFSRLYKTLIYKYRLQVSDALNKSMEMPRDTKNKLSKLFLFLERVLNSYAKSFHFLAIGEINL